jgi:hypothetical protein
MPTANVLRLSSLSHPNTEQPSILLQRCTSNGKSNLSSPQHSPTSKMLRP